jgi:hypothetical protein
MWLGKSTEQGKNTTDRDAASNQLKSTHRWKRTEEIRLT